MAAGIKDTIQLIERFNVAHARRLSASNNIEPRDRTLLGVKVRKFGSGEVPVMYTWLKYGRLSCDVVGYNRFVPTYMVGTKREVRELLAAGEYYDVDMVNSTPSLILQIADRMGMTLPTVKRYVDYREDVIKELMDSCKVDRHDAKDLMISLSFGMGLQTWATSHGVAEVPTFVSDYKREMELVAKLVLMENTEVTKWASLKKNNPSRMSAWALYVHTEERKCLLALHAAMLAAGRKVGALIHDGLMIERGEGPVNEELLDYCSQRIMDATGYDMKLIEKPMNPDMKLLEGNENSYEVMKETFEESHVRILLPPMYICTDLGKLKLLSTKQLHEAYSFMNCQTSDDSKPESFIAKWVRDDTCRRYKYMDFVPPPLKVPDETFNVWTPFAAENMVRVGGHNEELEEILDVLKALAQDDEECYQYFMQWTAQMVQEPGNIVGIAVIIKGLQGIGKNFYTELMSAILGMDKFYCCENAQKELFGTQFSVAQRFRVLVNIDESRAKTNYENNDTLKHMITSPVISFEEKGKERLQVRNTARFVFTTNNDYTMNISCDDRRFVVFEGSSRLKGKTDHWKRLFGYLKDESVMRAFYDHLMEIDITGVEWINGRPRTQIYKDMQSYNVPLEDRFLYEVASKARASGLESFELKTTRLFKVFEKWLVYIGIKNYNPKYISFCKYISRLSSGSRKTHGGVILRTWDCEQLLDKALEVGVFTPEEIPEIGEAPRALDAYLLDVSE